MISKEKREAWLKLVEAASKAPWRVEQQQELRKGGVWAPIEEWFVIPANAPSSYYAATVDDNIADAYFIAAAREAVPELLQSLEVTEADRDSLAAQVEVMRKALEIVCEANKNGWPLPAREVMDPVRAALKKLGEHDE